MRTYADVGRRMWTYADVLTYAVPQQYSSLHDAAAAAAVTAAAHSAATAVAATASVDTLLKPTQSRLRCSLRERTQCLHRAAWA
jgi:hypothetical protein